MDVDIVPFVSHGTHYSSTSSSPSSSSSSSGVVDTNFGTLLS